MSIRHALPIVFFFITLSTFSQLAKTSLLYDFVSQKRQLSFGIKSPALFKLSDYPTQNDMAALVKKSGRLEIDKTASLQLYNNKPDQLILDVPYDATRTYTLELAQQAINSFDDFAFGTIDGKGERHTSGLSQGLHYRGYVDGDPGSLASLSVFEDGTVMGFFSGKEGNFVIGKAGLLDDYTIYNNRDMLIPLHFDCATRDLPLDDYKNISAAPQQNAPLTLCKKVRFYWEANYALYSYNFKKNLPDTRNYLAGVFNQVAAVFQNEGIEVELAEAYVWTSTDPYRSNNSTNALADFKNRWNSLGNNFNGDIAHLVAGQTNNGGLAYILVNDLCNRQYAYGYSNVYAAYNDLPTFSWDVQVLSHEIGHNLGSNHTHWCGWNTGTNGTCGAIDNCFAVETSTICTTCLSTTDIASMPPGFQGTIMSYCYLKDDIGVNLAQGFGPLPQAAMRASINAASCPVLSNYWSGSAGIEWENAANWSCGTVPDANTDVTIGTGVPNYPVVNSAAFCHRLKQVPGTSVKINAGKTLNVVGK